MSKYGMTLAGKQHKVKTFVGLDQRISQADGITGMYVVVDVTG